MDRWTVLLPLRGGRDSKTRLAAGLSSPHLARRIAQAMAWDVIEAAVTTPLVERVVLLMKDPCAASLPAHLASDPRMVPTAEAATAAHQPDPLNAAVTGWLTSAHGERVAVVMPDLPCLRSEDLTGALRQAGGAAPSFIPDQEGTGTVLLAGAPADLTPRFGRGSAQLHERFARRIQVDAPRLRRDVDTVQDLTEAIDLGLGRHTTVLLTESGLRVCD